MPVPPLNLIEPRDALQRVRDAFDCTGDEAVRFLCDRWLSGEISPNFINGMPPRDGDPSMADWFLGAIVEPDKWLPRRAVSEPGDDPELQRIPGRSFPFKFARQQLEAALQAAGAVAPPPKPALDRWLPFWRAVEFIATAVKMRHGQALATIGEAAADECIAVYGTTECSHHNDVIPAWAWRRLGRNDPSEAVLLRGPGQRYDLGANRGSDLYNIDRYQPEEGGDGYAWFWSDLYLSSSELEQLVRELTGNPSAIANPEASPAKTVPGGEALKPDPRNKSRAMIEGLERALAGGTLAEGRRATLKGAYKAMLDALGHKSPPSGMGEDAFAKHCKPWLRRHGIYG